MVVKADDFSKRMCAAMRKAHMKAIDLHNLTGIGKPSISAYMAGEYEPKQRNLYKIAKALNVSTQYLMGIEDEQPPSPAPYQPYRAELTERDELTEHEREHIELYRELDERGRNAVDDLTDLHVERVRESTERSSGSTGTENAAEKRA